MEQNENLGKNSENFPFSCSLCQRKFKTYRGTLQQLLFCKKSHAIHQGEGTRTIIGTKPDNEMKYRKEIKMHITN